MSDYVLSAKLTADVKNFMDGFGKVKDQLNDLSEKTKAVSERISDFGKTSMVNGAKITALTAPVMMLGKQMLMAGMSFESTMSEVQAISGATGKDLDALKNKAQEMGAKTKFSATESAEALTYMAMAGWKTGDMLDGLEGIMDLAAASGEDLALTSDIVTDGLTGFGLSAKDSGRFADVLAAASSNANTNVAMLGESFKYVAPVAGALGFSVEDTSLALGLMANSGIKASQAGTSLRSALSKMVKPTKDAQGIMDEYDLSLTNSDGSMKSLSEIMVDLRSKMGGLDEATQAQTAATLFGQESMSGMLAIINAGEEDFDKLTAAINNSEGAAKEMADTMIDNLAGKITILKSGIEGFYLSIYDQLLPVFNKAAEYAQLFVDKLNGLSDNTKRFIGIAGILVLAVGPLVALFGAVATFGIAPLIGLLGAIVSPIGLVVTAVVGLAGGFAYLWNTSEKFRQTIQNVMSAIANSAPVQALAEKLGITEISVRGVTDQLQNFWMGIKAIFDIITGNITNLSQLDSQLEGAFGDKGFGRIANLLNIINDFKLAISGIAGVVTGQFSSFQELDNLFMGVFGTKQINLILGIGNTIRTVFDTAKTIVVNVASFIGTAFMTLGPMIIPTIQNIAGQIVTVFKTVWGIIQAVIPIFTNFFSSIVGGFGDAGLSGAGFVLNLSTVLFGLNPIIKGIITLFQNFGPQIVTAFQEIATMVIPVVQTVGQALGEIAASVIPLVMTAMATLVPIVVQLGMTFMNIVRTVLPVLIGLFNQFVPIISQVVIIFMNIIAQVIPLVGVLISSLLPVIQNLIATFMNIVSSVAPAFIAILHVIISVIQALVPVIMSIITVAVHVFAGIVTAISPIVAFIGTIITNIMAIITPIIVFVASIIASIIQVIRPIIAVVTGIFTTVFTVVSGIFRNIMNFIATVINSIGSIISGLTGVVSGVFNTIYSITSRIMGNVSNRISGVFEAIKSSWNGLTAFVGGIFDGISGSVQQLVNQVKGFVNGVIGGINAAVGLINKIPGVNISPIPYLARGTDDWQGGFARINEGGRGELVHLPGGTQVIPHDVSMRYAREAGRAASRNNNQGTQEAFYEGDVHIHIGTFENHTERDLERLSYDLAWMTKRERGRLGFE